MPGVERVSDQDGSFLDYIIKPIRIACGNIGSSAGAYYHPSHLASPDKLYHEYPVIKIDFQIALKKKPRANDGAFLKR